mgnify:FL=1
MKCRCYYCNEKLSERTVKMHVKGCKVRKEKIEESMASSKKTKSEYIEADKFDINDYEGNSEPVLHSAMNSMDLEIENRAKEMFNKATRGKFTYDLGELLKCNTKIGLLKIASILNIKKVSQFNKGQLVERLLEVYKEKITESLYLIDSERYEFLKSIAENQEIGRAHV